MPLLNSIIVLTLSFVFTSETALALGARFPKAKDPAPVQTIPTPAPIPETPAAQDPSEVASQVDRYFSSSQLNRVRSSVNSNEIDQCAQGAHATFAESVQLAVGLRMKDHKSRLGYVASAYGLPSKEADFSQVSLLSHPLCAVTAASLNTTLGSSRVPSAQTITKLNSFINEMNGLRQQALTGSEEAEEKIELKWNKFFMCLAYTESLTTADTSSSNNVAQKLAPSGYRKPAGVKFYDDPAQTAASRYNIGLFQFTPSAGGNIQACLREWNDNFSQCKVGTHASQGEMVKTLGSSQQVFNAFCGVSKITGMFSVQINTQNVRSTHPSNVQSSGYLKEPANRCVSLHFLAGRSYNHFGPLQNSTGKNLDQLFNCMGNAK